jgi:hypothetical protein
MGTATHRPRAGRSACVRRAGLATAVLLGAFVVASALASGACSPPGLHRVAATPVDEYQTIELIARLRGQRTDLDIDECIATLAERKDPAAADALAWVVCKGDTLEIRKAALGALQATGPKAAGGVLDRLETTRGNAAARASLVKLLGAWGRADRPTLQLLISGLGDKDRRPFSAAALKATGAKARDALVTTMRSGKKRLRLRCAELLGVMHDRRAAPVLAAAMARHGMPLTYPASTWRGARGIPGPVMEELAKIMRGGAHGHGATYVLLWWVLEHAAPAAAKAKARTALVEKLYRTDDRDLALAMWGEGDARLTDAAQSWAHAHGLYIYSEPL